VGEREREREWERERERERRTLNSSKSKIEDDQNKLVMNIHRFYSTSVSGLVCLVLKEAFNELQRDLKRNNYFPRINQYQTCIRIITFRPTTHNQIHERASTKKV
jgi:hypothetical protein